jgi:hypothetical protein
MPQNYGFIASSQQLAAIQYGLSLNGMLVFADGGEATGLFNAGGPRLPGLLGLGGVFLPDGVD